MGPRVQTVDRRSQATGLGEDVIRQLQGQLSQGAFGQGVGPLQRQAGTAIEQFVNELQQRQAAGTPQIDFSRLEGALTAGSQQRANVQAGDLREAFGAQGARFGTSLAAGEGRLRGDIARGLDETLGGLDLGAQQFNIQTGLQNQEMMGQQLLQGISQMFGQGQENLAPFMALAQMGIIPQEILASPGIGEQILSGILSGAGQAGGAFLGGR